MSIPIGVTQTQYNKIKRQLQTKDEVVCLDKDSHILYTLIALEMVKAGQELKAKTIKGY